MHHRKLESSPPDVGSIEADEDEGKLGQRIKCVGEVSVKKDDVCARGNNRLTIEKWSFGGGKGPAQPIFQKTKGTVRHEEEKRSHDA